MCLQGLAIWLRGQLTPCPGASPRRICPVRALTTSRTRSVLRHRLSAWTASGRSGPPSIAAKQERPREMGRAEPGRRRVPCEQRHPRPSRTRSGPSRSHARILVAVSLPWVPLTATPCGRAVDRHSPGTVGPHGWVSRGGVGRWGCEGRADRRWSVWSACGCGSVASRVTPLVVLGCHGRAGIGRPVVGPLRSWVAVRSGG